MPRLVSLYFTVDNEQARTVSKVKELSVRAQDNAAATDTLAFAATCARYVQNQGHAKLGCGASRAPGDRSWAIGGFNVFP